MTQIGRRSFVVGALIAPLVAAGVARAAQVMKVHKDPNCACCEAWVEHVRAAGYEAQVAVVPAINAIKAKLGVPIALRSCHTAEIDGYVLEGHVPAAAIARLLAQRPKVHGLAVPGMPIGSPGMEVEGRAPERYDVIAFGEDGASVFMAFRGVTPV